MKVTELDFPDVLFLELDQHRDERGWFLEFWNPDRMTRPEMPRTFVQDNIAFSTRGVLRGLHFQAEPSAQAKLITVTDGEVYDVAVDIRPDSTTFGGWTAVRITPGKAVYIPEGFAHGYQVLSDRAHVLYKCTRVYDPGSERALVWHDREVGVAWPIPNPIVSVKDQTAPSLAQLRARLQADRA